MDYNAFSKISYGVYIITSRLEDKLNGMVATTVCQVTSEPVRMTLCVNKECLTHEFILKTGLFGVSALKQDTSFPFIGGFGFKSGRNVDKFKGIEYETGITGLPLLTSQSVAVFEAKVFDTMNAGTHTIFLADVLDARTLSQDIPLTYDYYHTVIKGKSPKNAPTSIIHKV